MSMPRIAFIGAGNMAASLIGGLRADGFALDRLCASDPGEPAREHIKTEFGIQAFERNEEAVKQADIVFLAVKPQIMKTVCEQLAPSLRPGQLIISVAAGIACDSLERWLGEYPIVRCMPNTPALLRQGASGLFANPRVTSEQRRQAEQLLAVVGLAVWVDEESKLHAVTAVSGSGPAYFFLLMDAMINAGEALGLPREIATRLTLQTAFGSAQMALSAEVGPDELCRRVTSPNGTTAAALQSFHNDHFETIVEQALQAAADRSAEMAQQLGQ